MKDYSFISNAHPAYIENLYQQFVNDPFSVDEKWRMFFAGFDYNEGKATPATDAPAGAFNPKELEVLKLINGYRNRAHLLSDTNPIKTRKDRKPHIALKDFNLSEADLDTVFYAGKEIGLSNSRLKDIIAELQRIYCSKIGFEYYYIRHEDKRKWLLAKIESHHPERAYDIPLEKKRRILEKLNGAVVFEQFLGKKYVGQKRFSLEGGENAIVALDSIINKAADGGVDEVVMGMAHRGRLNVLANILGKTYDQIFNEFEGTALPELSFGDGDVKYHLGFGAQIAASSGKIMQVKLAPNPSHLESVDPVVEGYARAKADAIYESEYDRVLPVLIHGDAAVAGQGVVYETSQMSELKGYTTGGTIHLVINNQIGFTTDFDDARSSTYSTAAGNIVDAPIFHINGDDPEAVLFAAELAFEYRQKFNSDVYIDMVCYRKHGHNEGDDPQFTQPEMYKAIKIHKDPRVIYSEVLHKRGDLENKIAKEMEKNFKQLLQERLDEVREQELPYELQKPEKEWENMLFAHDYKHFMTSPKTGIDRRDIDHILNHILNLQEGFTGLNKVNRLFKSSNALLSQGMLDWAMAELLAYGSILMEGKDVRMSGQDVKRGTFSHRHVVLRDANTYKEYNRLEGLKKDQGKMHIYNSFLSEYAVLGFEYGYAMARPHTLTIWEGQFGDFYNGAQIMIDQYLTSAESKWQRMNGLVMYLPHGLEGQGPEHSSARLERFLQSAAEFNITVANVTKPANLFHLLRRQLERNFRKPLILMTPKSLLRHPEVISPIEEFETDNNFQEVYDDIDFPTAAKAKKVKKVMFCSGKIYYDLINYKKSHQRNDVAIVRLEQLYPLPVHQLEPLYKKYNNSEYLWVQEEPSNMGAWQYIHSFDMDNKLSLIARKSSASPATGYKKVHDKQQHDIVERAFA